MKREGITAVIAILVVASLGIGYLSGSSARRTEIITSTSTTVSTSTLTIQRTIASTTASCVTPPALQGDVNSFGPNPLSIVGPASGCAVASIVSSGSAPLADFTVAVNATEPLNLTIGFIYFGNNTAVLPPALAGINFTASDGIQNTAAAEPVAIGTNLANATSIAIPGGETTFHFQVQVPKSVAAGTYTFDVLILVSPNDTGGVQGAGVSFPVNVNAQ
jgi:hypothetical protein